jgi:formate hydrogenlyase transcriptional activator
MADLDLIGSSPKFKAVLDQIKVVAPVDSSVLVQGETGTGKEVIAKAIHDASSRRRHPFVPLNCAAIPSALLESELFGHIRGAFTGAAAQIMGRFQASDRGTLFLDEIGDLPLELQPKLLRVLQERQFERVGSNYSIQVDVRVIAATNQDLRRMVQDGRFRPDLYYRLNVFPMSLPALRERQADIPALVEHFVRKFALRQGKSVPEIPQHVMQALKGNSWPGKIRELQNFIERALIMTTGSILRAPIAELRTLGTQVAMSGTGRTFSEAARAHIIAALQETDWVVGGPNGAAARPGLPRTSLIGKMKHLGITRETMQGNHGRELSRAAAANSAYSPASIDIQTVRWPAAHLRYG